MTNAGRWQKIHTDRPDGQALFMHRDRDGAVAVADASGETPDRTDDGPLWLDVKGIKKTGCIELVAARSGGLAANVAVYRDGETSPYRTSLSCRNVVFLAAALDVKMIIRINDDAYALEAWERV